MGRVLGLGGATLIIGVCARQLLVAPPDVVTVAIVLAELVLVVRLVLLLLVGARDGAGARPVGGAEALLVEARSSIAVICTDEAIPAVRVAVSAAVAAVSAPRVLVVGDHPGLAEVAERHGVRLVRSDGSWWGGVRSALDSTSSDHLLLSSASTALIPGGLRAIAARWDDRCAFVQSDPVAPERRNALDHVRHRVIRPALDARRATPWEGPGSLVVVEVFRALPLDAGARANTVTLQRAGLHGRWCGAPVAALHGRSEPLGRQRRPMAFMARGLRPAQRLAQAQQSSDALGPAAFALVAAATVAALVEGELPIGWGPSAAVLAGGHCLAALGRLSATRGLLRPGALAVDDARRLGRLPALAVVVALDAALVVRAVEAIVRDRGQALLRDDLVLVALGVSVLVCGLAGVGVLERRRRLQPAARAVGPPVTAVVGDRTLPVVRMTSSAFDVVFDQAVALLGVVTVLLGSEGRRSVMVRGQVVRVTASGSGFAVTLRLVGDDTFGQHDDYVALWLATSFSAEDAPPLRSTPPDAGRMPVGARGPLAIRLTSAAVLACVGVATLPMSASADAGPGTSPATGAPATTTTVTLPAVTPATDGPAAADPIVVVGAAAAPVAEVDAPADPPGAGSEPTVSVSVRTGDGGASGRATLGQPFTWVVEVSNVSPAGSGAVASGIDLALELPPNWVYSATTGIAPIRCDSAPVVSPVDAVQTVTWTDMCALEPEQSLTLTVAAVPQPGAALVPGSVSADGRRVAHRAIALLTADGPAGTSLGRATASATATLRTADLAIQLSDGGPDDAGEPDSHRFVVGAIGRYRADVRNAGPDAAVGPITATLTIPNGFVTTGATGEGWACTVSLVVLCTHPGPVAVGGALPAITATVVPDAAALGTATATTGPGSGTPTLVTATATVASELLDGVPANDRDDEVTPVREEADLSITSALSMLTPAAPGARVELLLTVVNEGPSAAVGDVVVVDEIPPGLRLLSAQGAGWICGASRFGRGYTADPDENGALRCRRVARTTPPRVPLEPIVVRAQIDPLASPGTTVPQVGTVTHPADRVPADNTAGQSPPVPAPAAPAALALDGDRVASAGASDAAYDVLVGNQSLVADAGPIVAQGSVDGPFAPTAVAGSGWRCTIGTGDGTWSCRWAGTPFEPAVVPPGTALPPITVVGSVDEAGSGALRHTVEISGAATGAVTTATVATPIAPRAVLSVDAVAVDAPWPVDGRARSTITVANDGPSAETGPVTVTAEYDGPATVRSAGGDGWECRVAAGARAGTGGTVSCTAEPVRASSGVLVGPGRRLPAIGVDLDIVGTAAVRQAVTVAGTTDSTVRSAATTADVSDVADLSITASDDRWEPEVGRVSTVGWRVANDGPSAAPARTKVSVELPLGFTVDAVSAGWTCAQQAPIVSCNYDEPIASGTDVALDLDLAVGAEARSETVTAVATATVEGGALDPDADDTTVERRALVGDGDGSPATPSTTPAVTVPAVEQGDEAAAIGAPDLGEAALRLTGSAISVLSFGLAGVLAVGARRRRAVL